MRIPLTKNISPRASALIKSFGYWVLFVGLLFALGSLSNNFSPRAWKHLMYGLAGTTAAIVSTWIFLRTEKSSFKQLGLAWERNTLLKLISGVGIGILIFLLMLLMLLSFTQLELKQQTNTWHVWSLLGYVAILPLAFMEEIAFRSYPFLLLNKVFGLRITQWIVAIVFALYHIIQGWNPVVAFLGPATWAFVFGLAMVRSGGIALPTGIHIALNAMQQLVGMKTGDYPSIWTLQHQEGTTSAQQAAADNIGLVIQLVVLVCALILTESHIRKSRRKNQI